MSPINRFTTGAFVGADQDARRVDIAWAGACPRCAGKLAIIRDLQGGTLDVCDCGFSRPTPRGVMPAQPVVEKPKRRVSARAAYWKSRYAREQQARRAR